MVESTLWEEPLEVRVLFLTMLAIKEPDHVVRMPFRRLVKKAHMPPEQVQAALDVLMAPDTRSVDDQPDDGRRLRKVDDGWFVINGEYYRKEMQKLMTRIRKNNWQRENRKAAANLQNHQGPTASENHFDRNFDPQPCDDGCVEGKDL